MAQYSFFFLLLSIILANHQVMKAQNSAVTFCIYEVLGVEESLEQRLDISPSESINTGFQTGLLHIYLIDLRYEDSGSSIL